MKRNKNTRFTISPIFNSIGQITQVNTNNSHFFNVSEAENYMSDFNSIDVCFRFLLTEQENQ